MKTISVEMPLIYIPFSKDLLSRPIPKFRDDAETLWKMYQYIKSRMNKKRYANCKTFQHLADKFMELYGRAKAKEIDNEKEGKNSKCGTFYFINMPNQCDRYIFMRLRENIQSNSCK